MEADVKNAEGVLGVPLGSARMALLMISRCLNNGRLTWPIPLADEPID
jgi:hypothetical protein